MGRDKALLTWQGESFLAIALRNVKTVCDSPVIVGDAGKYSNFGRVVEDVFPSCGPLGGIHAALQSSPTELNLILSVDLPLMTGEFLRWMVAQAVTGGEVATVPQLDGRYEPLCAIYRQGILPVVESALRAGDYKVGRVFARVATRTICEAEITGAGFAAGIFRNVNTPKDYEWLTRRSAGAETEAFADQPK